jgi:hypothetical protein
MKMVDRRELETLIAKAKSAWASIEVERDETDHPISIAVVGLRGVGPFPMAPIAFAERMREVLS